MVAINIPDHHLVGGGMISANLPFTSSGTQRSRQQHQQEHAVLGRFGIKSEENAGLGLGIGLGVGIGSDGGVDEGGNGGFMEGYQDGHAFGPMGGNVFAGMDLNALTAEAARRVSVAEGQGTSGIDPSALMNLGLNGGQCGPAQRNQQQQEQQHQQQQQQQLRLAQEQHRQFLFDTRNATDVARHQQQQHRQHQQRLDHQQRTNGGSIASAGSAISSYSELASPDSDQDGDSGAHMTGGSGGESLASSTFMPIQPQLPYGPVPARTDSMNSVDLPFGNLVDPAANEPASGKAPTKRGSIKASKKEVAQTAEEVISGKTGKPLKPKSRKRVNTAEKRASHNAVERMRREQLNERFLDLARLLPVLANLRRPSKSAIVNGSITHLTVQRDQRLLAARELRNMHADYAELLAEVQDWRARNGVSRRENNVEWTEAMEEICSVEVEVFGVFTGVGGTGDDNEGDGDDIDGDDNMEEDESKDMLDLQQTMDTKRHSGASEVDVKPFVQGSRAPAATHVNTYVNRQMSFHSNASGEEAPFNNHNPQTSPVGPNSVFSAGSVITPPMHPTSHLTLGFNTSPRASAGPAFSGAHDPDQVATWAAQQVYLQYAQAQQAKRLETGGSGITEGSGSGSYGRHPGLDATQQMLHASHPHFAASVFPPPISTESPPHEGSFSGNSYMTSQLGSSHGSSGNPPTVDQMEMWQKLALGHFQNTNNNRGRSQGQASVQQNVPTINQLKEALRAGMSVGMGLANGTWSNNPEA